MHGFLSCWFMSAEASHVQFPIFAELKDNACSPPRLSPPRLLGPDMRMLPTTVLCHRVVVAPTTTNLIQGRRLRNSQCEERLRSSSSYCYCRGGRLARILIRIPVHSFRYQRNQRKYFEQSFHHEISKCKHV
eukprot:GHVU01226945.1.p1 GENE.GHVU01226945.1~~GHVU01226945.1.p1  ORF type:complete len:132 (-),score=3.97 GHVU01226945.1:9-404(-)